MTFDNLNLLGVLLAFGFSFVSGAIWFGPKTFYPIWMKARGIATGQLTSQQNKPALLFGGTIIGIVIQTITLAVIITGLQNHISDFSVSIIDGKEEKHEDINLVNIEIDFLIDRVKKEFYDRFDNM